MELLQLKYFCRAAETENFSQTAQEFMVPPSNISQTVKRLEDELGEKLFIRSGNRVTLNARGRWFYQDVQEALQLLDRAKKNISETAEDEVVRVGIGLRRRQIQERIARLQEKYPDIEIRADRFWSDSNPDDFDIIITDDDLKADGFVGTQVGHKKLWLTALKGKLPANDPLTVEQLRELTWISLPSNSVMYKNTLRVCRELGFEPKLLMQEEYSYYYVPRCVEEGMGVALVPEDTVWLNFVQEMLEKRDVGEYYRDSYIYRRRKTARSAPALNLVYNFLLMAFGSGK